MSNNKNSGPFPWNSPANAENRSPISSRMAEFEKRQNELWRLTFFLLLAVAIGYALNAFFSGGGATVRLTLDRFGALPIGLVLLVILFGIYAWKRTQEISELRGLVRGIEQRDSAPPSDRQLDQLFGIIARSQQGYRDLIDSFDDVLLALTLDGEIRAANRSFADLVGQQFEQIIGRPVSDFVEEGTGDGRGLLSRAMPRFLERRHWSGMVQIRIKNRNSVLYFDCVAHAMMHGEEVQGVTLLARDITALRKNEVRFTELFETLQEGIYSHTSDGIMLDANPAMVRMLGYSSKEDLMSRKVTDILPDADERRRLVQDLRENQVVRGREVVLRRKDGAALTCLISLTVVRDPLGNDIRYQGSLTDITERREMERRLHQQQEFARRLVDSFPDLILVLDSQGHSSFISPRIKDVLGYDAMETGKEDVESRAHLEDRVALQSLLAEITTGRQAFGSLELRLRHKNGDWRRIRCNFSPLYDERGGIDGVVISGRDVTDMKRLEEQLIQSEKLAAMGQMLAGVAHELNNPLTAILGVTELLREREGTEETAKRQLDLAHRQARRAARIVQNLLEFSRPATPQRKPLDISNLLDRTLQLHEHSLRRNNIEVDFQPQPNLAVVVGDANQLIQVFLNLISNAEQAIREVRENGRIQIRVGCIGSHVSITVQDDGVGIPSDAMPRIFDPFYTTKRPGGGTGLGLSICLSIIREHGGTIDVEALPMGGTAFTVYLPIVRDSAVTSVANAGAEPQEQEATRSSVGSLKGRSILVLDDEESIRSLLAEGLSAQGLRVDCAANDEEAMKFVGQNRYDILLCDLNLTGGHSGQSGHQAAQRILAASNGHAPTVIFMTGDLLDNAATAPGGPRHLQKPFRISEVLATFQEILASAPTEKAIH